MLAPVRWHQRFQSFDRAFRFLEKSLRLPAPNELERAGLIQAFEFTFALAWKVIKDYLLAQQVPVAFPREIFKEAFRYEVLADGEVWLDILEKRNLMAHTYAEERAALALELIRTAYFPALAQVLHGHLRALAPTH